MPLVLVADPGALPPGAPPPVSGAGQVWWIDPATPQSLTLHEARWLDVTVDLTAAADRSAWLSARAVHPNVGRQGAGGYWWRQNLSDKVSAVRAGASA